MHFRARRATVDLGLLVLTGISGLLNFSSHALWRTYYDSEQDKLPWALYRSRRIIW